MPSSSSSRRSRAPSPSPPTPPPPPSSPAKDTSPDSVPRGPIPLELPPGFRFAPIDSDMVWLLRRKVAGLPPTCHAVPGVVPPRDLDISLFEPEELPWNNATYDKRLSYFFTKRTLANPGGGQPSRPTPKGCWKGTGKDDRQIGCRCRGGVQGFKKMYAYYKGKAPNEVRTVWVMKEVRLNPRLRLHRTLDPQKMQNYVMCKVYNSLEEDGIEDLESSEEED